MKAADDGRRHSRHPPRLHRAPRGDYRAGDIPAITPEHVDRWVRQFQPDEQAVLVREMDRLLQSFYVPQAEARHFLSGFISHRGLFGWRPREALKKTRFLRIQRKGNSQNDLLTSVDSLLREKYGFGVDDCGASQASDYVYLDDGLFTGRTAYADLARIVHRLPTKSRLHLVFLAMYATGLDHLRTWFEPLARARQIAVRYWRSREFQNRRHEAERHEALWPRWVGEDAATMAYTRRLMAGRDPSWSGPRLYRPSHVPRYETLFSSAEARHTVEQALLRAGLHIVSLARDGNPLLRPLGYDQKGSLGFGAVVVTYRNCPNNCPLALWWGDPDAAPWTTLGQWFPLFNRRPRAATFAASAPATPG